MATLNAIVKLRPKTECTLFTSVLQKATPSEFEVGYILIFGRKPYIIAKKIVTLQRYNPPKRA